MAYVAHEPEPHQPLRGGKKMDDGGCAVFEDLRQATDHFDCLHQVNNSLVYIVTYH